MDDTDVTYQNAIYSSDLKGFGGDVAIGFDSFFAKDWSAFAEVLYEQSENVSAGGFTVGIRYSW